MKKIVGSIQKLILFKTPHGMQIETEPRPYLLLSRCTRAHRPLSATPTYRARREAVVCRTMSPHRVAMSIFDLLETIKIECEDSKAVCRLQAANSTDNPRRFNSPVSASVRAVSSSISIRRRSSVKSIARPTILPG